ncbi:MAG: hypothetical protein QXD43_03095 [Candidatus Aenigmatarchaeota archaeon]
MIKITENKKTIIQDPYYDQCGCYCTSDGEIVLCDYHQQLEEEAEQCPYGCTIDEGCIYGPIFELCHACPNCIDMEDDLI